MILIYYFRSGLSGPKRSIHHSIVVKFIKTMCLQWSLLGCMALKQGPNWGYRAPKQGHKLGCNTLNPKPGSNLGYGPQNGVRIGLFTLKLDLWTAFGYTGFWVYGLFGRGGFGYTGFSVVAPKRVGFLTVILSAIIWRNKANGQIWA
jgi:hypothetical protein